MLLDQVRHWLDSGGDVRLRRLTNTASEIELRACTGEVMERLRTSDPALLARLEAELAERSAPGSDPGS